MFSVGVQQPLALTIFYSGPVLDTSRVLEELIFGGAARTVPSASLVPATPEVEGPTISI